MASIPTNSDIFKLIEDLAPKTKAYDWDNVGLQIGNYQKQPKKIMITLDVIEAVVDEAIENNVDLIIAHHPLFFKSLKRIDTNTPEGRIISKLIRHDITVYAAHTNLDVVEQGVNDILADKLDITDRKPLIGLGSEKLYKYAVYVPQGHEHEIKEVLGRAGAGLQGNYSHCSFQLQGIGAFKPLTGAEPFIGKVDEVALVNEFKIEAIVPESRLNRVIKQVMTAHPYEEPAFDIVELKNEGEAWGLGRVGKVAQEVTLQEYVVKVKEKLNLTDVRVVGDLNKKIKKAAIVGGSGEKYIHNALRAGADVYITGDLSFHPAQAAWQSGLAVIDAGHYIEATMKDAICDYLQSKLGESNIDVLVSHVDTDPFKYL